MFRVYCPGEDGVAIRTTFAKLRDSVNDPHTCVSEVKYFAYKAGRFPRHIHDWDRAFRKRITFKHEQEVRVLRRDVAGVFSKAILYYGAPLPLTGSARAASPASSVLSDHYDFPC